MARSEPERNANDFDATLYALLCRAETLAERAPEGGAKYLDWMQVCRLLRLARSHVRKHMHKDDREQTQ